LEGASVSKWGTESSAGPGSWECPHVSSEVHQNRPPTALVLVQLAACPSTRTTSVTWVAPPAERLGEVSWIRQTSRDQQGNPVGGAVVGALVGGVFGRALTGGRGGGTLVGAAGGAAAGAAISQGSSRQESFFDVGVR